MAKTSTLGTFHNRTDAIGEALEKDINQLVTDIVSTIAGEVAKRTPVDTALARSNWVTSVGRPATGILFPYRAFPSRWRASTRSGKIGKGGKFTERINTNSVIEQARVAMISRKPDQDVFLVNNVDYLTHLNAGKSPQSPAGFVQAGVAAGRTKAIRQFKFRHLRKV